jgi:nucleoside-diphosphate-sugar epimerase
MEAARFMVKPDEPILITGAAGFLGPAVVERALYHGFRHIRAFIRPSSDASRLSALVRKYRSEALVEVISGDLLMREDCKAAAKGAAVIFHLATTSGDKSFAGAYLNSVVTTRNLLDASLETANLKRFVNVSSFAVYTNTGKHSRLLDESAPVETQPERRGEAYCYAKTKQDEIVAEYGRQFGLPYVIVRPGSVYGPGKTGITGRVGIDSFGPFLHMGGGNTIPFTYVDNCADAILFAGVKEEVDGEVFNIVDDDLPSSRRFLRLYKRNVKRFRSLYVPRAASYALCWLWEKYYVWSEGQLPPAFNRGRWHAEWKKTRYSNEKAKTRLGWRPQVSMDEGLRRYFEACREAQHA